jgi:glycosylphosphatidylinositol transamidase
MLTELVWIVYRTNTFPLVHVGFFHALMNILALTPLLERFEAEYGTLTTLALFLGRKAPSWMI